MRLFLASEGINPETIKKLKDYIGGFKKKKMVYIPTAANAEGGWESWKKSDSWNFLNTLGAEVSSIQLEDYRNSEVINLLKGKDIIWMAGGYAGYLMYWIRRTKLDINMLPLLKNGTIYVGSSAGSMITGRTLDVAEWFLGDGEPGAHFIPGLGLVDFDIYPHYEESMLPEIKKNYKGSKMYLLKNGEEIVFEDGKVTVQGEERIVYSK